MPAPVEKTGLREFAQVSAAITFGLFLLTIGALASGPVSAPDPTNDCIMED